MEVEFYFIDFFSQFFSVSTLGGNVKFENVFSGRWGLLVGVFILLMESVEYINGKFSFNLTNEAKL